MGRYPPIFGPKFFATMIISLLVAAADNNVIGKDNRLLWCLPDDMRFFKNTSWALPAIMGRKTFESLGKPLAGRYNIVVTSQSDWNPAGVAIAASLQQAVEKAQVMETNEIMVIGGGQIYNTALPMANRIYITRVHCSPEGDTWFPTIDPAEWKLVASRFVAKDSKNDFDHTFETWERQ